MWFDPGPAPYHYRVVEEGGADKFPKLELNAWPDLKISKQEMHVEGMTPDHTARDACLSLEKCISASRKPLKWK